MDIELLKEFHKLLVNYKANVSKLEYTKNNYDSLGELIEEEVPILTTDFCEIGSFNGEVYFVFVVVSETFDIALFNKLKKKKNMEMYGFEDFKKTLYPVKGFTFGHFMLEAQKDKYLQIQFDYEDFNAVSLFKEYSKLINIFEKNKVKVVNQLQIDLTNASKK